MTGVLVVGYGNSLRGDDGIGWHVAGRLAADPCLAGARVLAHHQLTPELATDVAAASLVVLVDATTGAEPGSIQVRWIQPQPDERPTWSHHIDPEALAGLAAALYDAVPPVAVVSVASASFASGDQLSEPLQRALPQVVQTVARVVEDHRRTCAESGTGQ